MRNKQWELVNFCELDKYAIKSYCAIRNEPESKNLGDITKVDETKLKPFNMICGGSPCQDFSVAGKQKGSVWTCKDCRHEYNPLTIHWSKRNKCPNCHSLNIEKTRSSLLVEYLRVVRENKPNFGIYENVKNIVGKSFKNTFDMFIKELEEYGYNIYYQVLNAKNYGIPQNRERVYLIFIKKELDNGKFSFPKPFDNGLRVVNILEKEVEEKYYINNEKTNILIEKLNNTNCYDNIICEQRCDEGLRFFKNNICGSLRTIDSCGDKRIIKLKQPKERFFKQALETLQENECEIGDTINAFNKTVNKTGVSPTLTTRPEGFKTAILPVISNNNYYSIRKLTPKECWRLMGFEDEDIDNCIKNGISNAQLYKQAGNSIVVDVLYYIYKELYIAMPYLFDDLKLTSLFSGIGAFEKALDRLYKNDINKIIEK